MGQLELNAINFEDLLYAITSLKDTSSFWKPALPIFLAAILGLGTAVLLDWQKTRRERENATRTRLEKELAQLNGVNAAIAFDIESVIHTAMQQVLPHYTQSQKAAALLPSLRDGSSSSLDKFYGLLNTDFEAVIQRSPEPFFIDMNLFEEFSFLLLKDPDLVGVAGWVLAYKKHLKSNLSDRNKLIDLATLGDNEQSLEGLENLIASQGHIGEAEVVNSYQLFLMLKKMNLQIEKVITLNYKHVPGAGMRLKMPIESHEIFKDLERLARKIRPDLPPSDTILSDLPS